MALTKVQSAMIGGGTGAAFTPNTPIYENTLTITSPYTLTTGNNAFSIGPVVISGSGSVTVPTGQRWVVM